MDKKKEKTTRREVLTGRIWSIYVFTNLDVTNIVKKPTNITKLETTTKTKVTTKKEEEEVPKKKTKHENVNNTDSDTDSEMDDLAERMAKLFLRF